MVYCRYHKIRKYIFTTNGNSINSNYGLPCLGVSFLIFYEMFYGYSCFIYYSLRNDRVDKNFMDLVREEFFFAVFVLPLWLWGCLRRPWGCQRTTVRQLYDYAFALPRWTFSEMCAFMVMAMIFFPFIYYGLG